MESGFLTNYLNRHTDYVNSVSFSPCENYLISGSGNLKKLINLYIDK
jgi:WD40 repeat protein